jgi:hypothetical protein
MTLLGLIGAFAGAGFMWGWFTAWASWTRWGVEDEYGWWNHGRNWAVGLVLLLIVASVFLGLYGASQVRIA